MTETVYVGIDPGLEGAVAVLGPFEPRYWDVPTVGNDYDVGGLWAIFAELSRKHRDCLQAALEWPQSHPGNSAGSNVMIGEGRGLMRMVLTANGIPYTRITPAKWKQHFGLKKNSAETQSIVKEKSRAKAMELFPTAELHLKKHHNRAEALLIAEYLRRTHPSATREGNVET